jgi:hypothetical protein
LRHAICKKAILALFIMGSVAISKALNPPFQAKKNTNVSVSGVAAVAIPNGVPVPSIPASIKNGRAAERYRRLWGIDDIHVRSTASGSLIRFSYRVVDRQKAKIFSDKRVTPLLIDEKTNLALQVPVMEKIGQLRQVTALQDGKEYWMAFSNKGRHVKPGDAVDLSIGNLRLEGLVVESGAAAQLQLDTRVVNRHCFQ